MKTFKKLSLLVLAVIVAFSTVACKRKTSEEEKNYKVETEKQMDDVEDGGFYILHSDSYEKLYVANANYEIAEENASNADPKRTLWFKEDFEKIPTMYTGDMLIYKTSDVLDENFTLERFEYVGYTVGVTSLKETPSGRYSYTTAADAMNIYSESDATQLYDIPTETAIIDRIGFADLRSGNVSSGGCILGLEKDKTYEAEVYAGTFLNRFTLTADSIAMTSMEFYKTVEYRFLQSQILQLYIPEYFNSGYYLINGYGLVRYVNGTSYDELTDFNIPNEEPEPETESAEDTDADQEKEGDEKEDGKSTGETSEYTGKQIDLTSDKIEFSIEESGTYTLKVSFEKKDDPSLPSPAGYLISSVRLYSMELHDNVISCTQTLPEGNYTIEVTGLNGRKYEFAIEPFENPVDQGDETEEEKKGKE